MIKISLLLTIKERKKKEKRINYILKAKNI
jgi:hypothetical protein